MSLLNPEIETEIAAWADSDSVNESGGLIIETEGGIKVFNCKNNSKNPQEHFLISHAQYEEACVYGKVVGFWHSHPDGSGISDEDKYIAEKFGISSIVYRMKNGFLEYEPMGWEIPYLERPYHVGILDCAQLVVDYYFREYNIILDLKAHPLIKLPPEEWLNHVGNVKGNSFLRDNFHSQGFVEKTGAEKGDLLLFTLGVIKCPSHCGIYMGDNKFMHHAYLGKSEIIPYSIYWRHRTTHIMKHNSL